MQEKVEQPSFWDPMTLFGLSAALSAAQSTGLLGKVLTAPATADECAAELGLSAALSQRVLEVFVASGLLLRSGDHYGPRGADDSLGPYSRQSLLSLQEQFAHTTRVLRTGEPMAWMDESLAQLERTYSTVAAHLGVLFADTAARLAVQVGGEPERILDIGCGSGVWSLALAAISPRTQVTGLDLPSVLSSFQERARQLGLSERVSLLPGDMSVIELPEGQFELVILANVLRLEPELPAQQLVARAARALRPGGRMLIVDALAGGTPERELLRATYVLNLALRTRRGRVHSAAELTAWMEAAGLLGVAEIDCGAQMGALGALLGHKPA